MNSVLNFGKKIIMLCACFLKIYVYIPSFSHFYFACVANNCCPTLLLYLHEGKPQRRCLRNQRLVTPISPAGSLWLDRHNLRLSSSNSNTSNDLIHMDFPVLAPATRLIVLRKSGQRPSPVGYQRSSDNQNLFTTHT